jgi:hypothetical protein
MSLLQISLSCAGCRCRCLCCGAGVSIATAQQIAQAACADRKRPRSSGQSCSRDQPQRWVSRGRPNSEAPRVKPAARATTECELSSRGPVGAARFMRLTARFPDEITPRSVNRGVWTQERSRSDEREALSNQREACVRRIHYRAKSFSSAGQRSLRRQLAR